MQPSTRAADWAVVAGLMGCGQLVKEQSTAAQAAEDGDDPEGSRCVGVVSPGGLVGLDEQVA